MYSNSIDTYAIPIIGFESYVRSQTRSTNWNRFSFPCYERVLSTGLPIPRYNYEIRTRAESSDPRSLWIVKYSSRGIARSTRIYLTKLRLFISMDEPLFSRTIRFSLPSLSVSISLDERKRERKNSLHVSYFVALSQLSNWQMPGPNVAVPIQDKSIWIFPLSKVEEAESTFAASFSPCPPPLPPLPSPQRIFSPFLVLSRYFFLPLFPLAPAPAYPPIPLALSRSSHSISALTGKPLLISFYVSPPFASIRWSFENFLLYSLLYLNKLIPPSLFLSRVDSTLLSSPFVVIYSCTPLKLSFPWIHVILKLKFARLLR